MYHRGPAVPTMFQPHTKTAPPSAPPQRHPAEARPGEMAGFVLLMTKEGKQMVLQEVIIPHRHLARWRGSLGFSVQELAMLSLLSPYSPSELKPKWYVA